MPRFALCIRNHETSSNKKLSDIIRNHQIKSSWSSYTNYINHIPTTYQYQAYTNPSSSASARAPMDTRKRTAKLTWELWPPYRISPWSIGFIGFTLWQITSNIINITNIDPENHQVFLKTDWKLIFQPLPGRVYVNLLEGNHEKWGHHGNILGDQQQYGSWVWKWWIHAIGTAPPTVSSNSLASTLLRGMGKGASNTGADPAWQIPSGCVYVCVHLK